MIKQVMISGKRHFSPTSWKSSAIRAGKKQQRAAPKHNIHVLVLVYAVFFPAGI